MLTNLAYWVVPNSMSGIVSSVDQLENITDQYGTENTRFLASLIRRPIFFQIYMGLYGFSFKLIIFFFWKNMQILFTDRVLLTIRRIDHILGGRAITVILSRPNITVAYAFISFRFRPSLTGLAWLR